MPAPKQPFFQYNQLHDPNNEIRLLSLQPETSGDLLQFTLFTIQLSPGQTDQDNRNRQAVSVVESLPYKALSYEWGESNDCKTISVNGDEFYVQRNLHSFLQAIYFHHKDQLPVNFWVDAVCINQDTDDTQNVEKNHQVRLMGRVYSRAEMVLIWLGESYNMGPVKSLLREILQFVNFDDIFEDTSRTIDPMGLLGPLGMRLFYDYTLKSHANDRPDRLRTDPDVQYVKDHVQGTINILVSLWELSYWRRLWVAQELVLARDFTLICDPRYCSAETGAGLTKDEVSVAYLLAHGLGWAYIWGEPEPRTDEPMTKVGYTGSSRFATIMGETFDPKSAQKGYTRLYTNLFDSIWQLPRTGMPLAELITRFADFACSIPHDHVYGLLGLATDVTEDSFEVDYQSDCLDLLRYVITCWCTGEQRCDVAEDLMAASGFGPPPITIHEDGDGCSDWLTGFGIAIGSKGSDHLSTLVVVDVDESAKGTLGNEENVGCVNLLRSIAIACGNSPAVGDRLVLGDVVDPENPFTIGRNSHLVLDYDFLKRG